MTRTHVFNRALLGSLTLSALALAFTNIALGADASPTLDSMDRKVESMVSNLSGNKNSLPEKFISDGKVVEISRLGLKVAPPTGWEVLSNHPTLSLVLQEVAPEKIQYDVPIYQRNITVAAIVDPAPIDEKRAEELKKEITDKFGKQGGVENFQVIEHKLFDYHGKNDGLVVFSAFKHGEFNLQQMHVLLSGEKHQVLMTYTDLQERFAAPETYNLAWNSMATAQVTGLPPMRYQFISILGGLSMLLLVCFMWLRRMRATRERSRYMADADVIYKDDQTSGGGMSFEGASVGSQKKASFDGDFDFPKTVSAVWNLGDLPERSEVEDVGAFSNVTGF